MVNKFESKVFVENRRSNIVFRVFLFVVAIVIMSCILIKILVGDFHLSDIAGILLSTVIIFNFGSGRKPKPEYAMTTGTIDFEDNEMKITYHGVDGGEKYGKFTETTIIRYEDIEFIEYAKALSCYRIVAKCYKKRFLYKFDRVNVINNYAQVVDTYLYVNDDEEDEEIRSNLQNYTGCNVEVINPNEVE